MKVEPMRYISPKELVGLPNNPRTITKADLNRLCDSLRINGFWEHRPMAVEKQDWTDKFVVLDGNQRLKAARRLKMKSVPIAVYSELTDEERNEIIFRSNINNGEWDFEAAQEFEGVDFEGIGLHLEIAEPEDEQDEEPLDAATEDEDKELEDILQKKKFANKLMGDFLYPTNNEFEIPTLLTDNMPIHLELPLEPWGVESRHKVMHSTYHFYVDDYRFEALFKDPMPLVLSGCKMIVEPNVSIHDNTPPAYALWQIYRKRYLSRYLQECGMQIWVDLNVPQRFAEWNLLGVPDGYNAFSTRGVSGWQPTLDIHYEQAKRVSGLDHPNLVVYGGGKDIQQWAMEHELAWHPEFINGKQRNDK